MRKAVSAEVGEEEEGERESVLATHREVVDRERGRGGAQREVQGV